MHKHIEVSVRLFSIGANVYAYNVQLLIIFKDIGAGETFIVAISFTIIFKGHCPDYYQLYIPFHSKMGRVMRKPDFCICENKDADKLCSNGAADQCLCFRYTDSTIPLLPKSEILSL